MTGRQRAALRGMANGIQPIYQLGKGGIDSDVITGLDEALTARELIKITVLDAAGISAREACDQLAEALRAEPIQVIGKKLVLYRRNYDAPKIQL